MSKTVNIVFASLLSFGLSSCATISSSPVVNEATAETYAAAGNSKGVVVLSVNWARHWKCGEYQSAEIQSLGFDRLPLKGAASDSPSEVFLDGPPRLLKKPLFFDYALLLEPGEYALTSFDISVGRPISEAGNYRANRLRQGVGGFRANRSQLVENNKPLGGSFVVKAGEAVYIGNFYIECDQQPTIWRYYTEGRDNFREHMVEVKQKYPFIDPDKVKYRLFRTTALGLDYELPQ